MKNKNSKRLTLKEKLDIIEYKKANKIVKNTRISEIFGLKFKKNISPRSIKNFLESEESIINAYLINNKLISVPRIIKQVDVECRLKDWVDMIEGQGGYISESILKNKALQIYNSLIHQDDKHKSTSDFTAFNG
ncbi:hypothetical protein DMUE_4096 [Dictyocoela muelleri]|nr:hypothetical protein DMUE_4096 [Dictyocoela muelleri]